MHLTDEQLLEPNEQEREHIRKCDTCSLKANNLLALQHSLNELPELEPMAKTWQQLEQSISKIAPPRRKQSKFTLLVQRLSFQPALAASLLLVTAVYLVSGVGERLQSQENEMAALVKQNQELQQALFLLIQQRDQAELTMAVTQYELSKFDEKLQQAYLQAVSKEELFKLWSERRSKLEVLHSQNQQRHLQQI